MKKINKFLFIVPNSRWFGKRCWLWYTPAVPILVPILRQHGISVDVLEANIDNLSANDVRAKISASAPDMVGITNMSLEYWRQPHLCAQLAKEVDKNIITLMGGVHPTTLPRKVMEDENIDHIILAEGEERLPIYFNILQSASPDFSQMDGIGFRQHGEIIINKPTKWIDDLNQLPLPDYSLFDWDKLKDFKQETAGGMSNRRAPIGVILTSRGCNYRCCFCAGSIIMGRKTRFRSPENVLKEIDLLVHDYGIKELVFQDDEMYADRERAVEIISRIKQRKYDLIWKNINIASWRLDYDIIRLMKESGCYQITISPESGSERVLKKIIHKPMNKEHCFKISRWCKELDIELQADFVIGFPGETWDEIRMTTNFAEELDADSVKFAVATPFPGTELFRKAVEGGYLKEDHDFYQDQALGFANPVIETEEFTINELKMIRCLEWDRINFRTKEKKERYARVNMLTMDELDAFRKETRRNLGRYFLDQAKGERE